MKKPKPSILYLFYKHARRNINARKRKNSHKFYNKVTPLYKGKSVALEAMKLRCTHSTLKNILNKYGKNYGRKQSRHSIIIPEIFSIIEKPMDALQVIYDFIYILKEHSPRFIYYNHGKLKEYDLGAEAILDYISEEYLRECSLKKIKVKMSGEIRADHQLSRFMKGIGIIKSLGNKEDWIQDHEFDTIKIFKKDGLNYDYKANAFVPSRQEITISDFVKHIDNCLLTIGKCLTREARHSLGSYLGEILDNIDQHSGCRQWRILGYLDMMDEAGICEIVIFNYGQSVANSMLSAPLESLSYESLKSFVENFKHRNPKYNEENDDILPTLYALQECVSCKNIDIYDDRGMGTMEFIDFFQNIHDECLNSCKKAKMALLSGSVHILFDGKHRINVDSKGKRFIAFNDKGDIYEQYDKSYVKSLSPYYFPGTIISIRFPLDRNMTEGV